MVGVLEDKAYAPGQFGGGGRGGVDPVDGDRARSGVQEPRDETGECRLSGTVLSDECDQLTRPEPEVETAKGLHTGRVDKSDILQLN